MPKNELNDTIDGHINSLHLPSVVWKRIFFLATIELKFQKIKMKLL